MSKRPSGRSDAVPTPREPVSPAKQRRSLTHVGGEVRTRGDQALAARLAHALDVASSVAEDGEDAARAHVHGFHAYPARMHPRTAERLVGALSTVGQTVLDPFCGGGTVLVEARLLGRRAIGVDLNPLAVMLARRKATPMPPAEREALLAAAASAAAVATERRKAKTGASRRYPQEDVASFDPHVLLELDGLRIGIEACADSRIKSDLLLVLSSILVKLSRRRSDTSTAEAPKRLAAGYPARLFVNKATELTRAFEAVDDPLRRAPTAVVFEGDARELRGVETGSVDAVVTSPPYAGVYDYLEHHRARLRWLGKDARAFIRAELGAKRSLAKLSPDEAIDTYGHEMTDVLRALHRVMKPGGLAALLVADSAFGRTPLAADSLVVEAGRRAGFEPRASASQTRPHFDTATRGAFARAPRLEHVVVLERDRAPASPVRRSRQ